MFHFTQGRHPSNRLMLCACWLHWLLLLDMNLTLINRKGFVHWIAWFVCGANWTAEQAKAASALPNKVYKTEQHCTPKWCNTCLLAQNKGSTDLWLSCLFTTQTNKQDSQVICLTDDYDRKACELIVCFNTGFTLCRCVIQIASSVLQYLLTGKGSFGLVQKSKELVLCEQSSANYVNSPRADTSQGAEYNRAIQAEPWPN